MNPSEAATLAKISQGDVDCFIVGFRGLATSAHANSVNKGFWEVDRNDGESIALMHQELSEALDAIRDGGQTVDSHCPEFLNLEIEFADVIIRIMDFAKARGLRVSEALVAKMMFNRSRPHKHGRKL